MTGMLPPFPWAKFLPKLLREERGVETLEYALVAGLIAVIALSVYLNTTWPATLRNRLTESVAAERGHGACPVPPCGEPPPCGHPPCGKGK